MSNHLRSNFRRTLRGIWHTTVFFIVQPWPAHSTFCPLNNDIIDDVIVVGNGTLRFSKWIDRQTTAASPPRTQRPSLLLLFNIWKGSLMLCSLWMRCRQFPWRRGVWQCVLLMCNFWMPTPLSPPAHCRESRSVTPCNYRMPSPEFPWFIMCCQRSSVKSQIMNLGNSVWIQEKSSSRFLIVEC